MCAIVDANIAYEVFGENRPPAGERFFEWLSSPRGRLVVGGKLDTELRRNNRFRDWMRAAIGSGHVRQFTEEDLAAHAVGLARRGHRSDDPHVLALAAASGVRLLYTNDGALIDDFRDSQILANPGKVYTTKCSKNVSRAHKRLLQRRDLCRTTG